MYKVIKRDNQIADFNISKITGAIESAFQSIDKQYNKSVIELLAIRVTSDFEAKIIEGMVSVEDIQDSVEVVLIQAGYADVAKTYI